jgi:hypothetical protein
LDNSWINDIYNDADIDSEVNTYPAYVVAGRKGTTIDLVHLGVKVTQKVEHFLHHVLPKYLGRILGKTSEVLARMPASLHQGYHNYISRGMHAAEDLIVDTMHFPNMNAPRREMTAWINGCRGAGIADAVMKGRIVGNLRRLTGEFATANRLEGLVEALDDVFKDLGLLE